MKRRTRKKRYAKWLKAELRAMNRAKGDVMRWTYLLWSREDDK